MLKTREELMEWLGKSDERSGLCKNHVFSELLAERWEELEKARYLDTRTKTAMAMFEISSEHFGALRSVVYETGHEIDEAKDKERRRLHDEEMAKNGYVRIDEALLDLAADQNLRLMVEREVSMDWMGTKLVVDEFKVLKTRDGNFWFMKPRATRKGIPAYTGAWGKRKG